MKNETWKDIINYNDIYQISDLGQARSLNYQCKINRKDMINILLMIKENIPITIIAKKFNITETHIRRIKKNPDKFINRIKILKLYKEKQGYMSIGLWKNKTRKTFRIHNLMMEAFIGPCPSGMEVCHNNGIKNDNRLMNLRYDTKNANWEDSVKHGTRFQPNNVGENHGQAKLNNWIVRIIKQLLKQKILKQKEISEIFNINHRTISAIKNDRIWNHIK